MLIIIIVLVYFALLVIVSRVVARGNDNASFFRGNRKSPWWLVSFGMIGASISGVSFVSVPGMVMTSAMTYLQTCLGFILGYLMVAFILLPVYYHLNLTTIYSYLGQRLGWHTYQTGAWFFIISKLSGAALKFFVVCMLLHTYVLKDMGVPFVATVAALVACIWLYTSRGGIRALVYTDTLQTVCMIAALVLMVTQVTVCLHLDLAGAVKAVTDSEYSRVFVFDDWMSKQNFFKQFFSGAFIVVVMTGLDQDMMQKNLTCKTLREAQKDMCAYGCAFVPVNALLLSLGVMLTMLATSTGAGLPATGDSLLPMFAATGQLGTLTLVMFTVGIVAASFSSADSALTALTTTVCVDILAKEDDKRLRMLVHAGISIAFVVFILAFNAVNSTSLLDAVYIICSYTYGPLLGVFAFGLFTRRDTRDKVVPFIAVASPVICYLLDMLTRHIWHYQFGYELLLLNGAITFAGLYACTNKKTKNIKTD